MKKKFQRGLNQLQKDDDYDKSSYIKKKFQRGLNQLHKDDDYDKSSYDKIVPNED
jgi:3-methyladenine DNA glycosylase AlkC